MTWGDAGQKGWTRKGREGGRGMHRAKCHKTIKIKNLHFWVRFFIIKAVFNFTRKDFSDGFNFTQTIIG